MTTFTDVFGNSTLPPAEYGFASYSLTTDSTFVWPYNTDSVSYTIAKIMDVTCASGNSLILPDAMEVSSGEDFLIRNVGSNTLIVKNSAGTQIATVAIGAASYFYLTDNSTAAGVYGVIGFGVGTSTADAASLVGYGIKAVGASLNQSHPVVPTNTGITLGTDHRAKLIVFTGGVATFALTSAATLGDDYFTMFRNDGTGTVTIDPASSETLDGMTTMQVQPGESLILICTGTQWYSVGYGRSTLYQFTQLTKDVSAGGTITLSAAEAANKLITFIGNPAGAVNVVVPGVVAVYYTQSSISTAQTVTLKTASGSGVGISQGARIIALCDGTNVVSAQSAVANTSVSLTDGSSAVPSLFFATQTNTGLYKSGTQDLGVTVNGSTTGVFGSTGLQTSTIGPNSTQRHTLPAVTSDTVTLNAASQTLTNKTLTSPVISTINNTGTLTLPTSTDTLVGRATTDTLTNKTVNLTNNTLSGTKAQFDTALTDDNFIFAGTSNTFSVPQTISANSTSAALTITQDGTGHALVVNDVTGDTTPFVINANGDVGIGAAPVKPAGFASFLAIGDSDTGVGQISDGVLAFSTNNAERLRIGTDGGMTIAGSVIQNTGTTFTTGGNLTVRSPDGVEGGQITLNNKANTSATYNFDVDASDHGRLFTTQNNTNLTIGQIVGTGGIVSLYTGAAERMRIDSSGNVGIGAAPYAGSKLYVSGTMPQTGGICLPITMDGTIPSTATFAQIYRSSPFTQAASYTLLSLTHFYAAQNIIGAGSTVTSQYGFYVDSSLTGATDNYGFYSNIPSGTGRWNFFAAGAADNYFAGSTGIGTLAASGNKFQIGGTYSGGSATRSVVIGGTIDPTVSTVNHIGTYTVPSVAAGTLPALYSNYVGQGTFTGTVTSHFGFIVDGLIGATNNYGFYSNIASGTGRWNFYAAGTADNYFAGKVGVGTTPGASVSFHVANSITGGVSSFGSYMSSVVQSDVTSLGSYYTTSANTVASAFTLSTLNHFRAAQNIIGAGSTVTNQMGFIATNTLTGATNNYGFYSDVASGTGRWNFYAAGTAANYFAGDVGIGHNAFQYGKLSVVGGKAGTDTSSACFVTPGSAQGEIADLALYSTFTGTADNAPRRTADIIAGFNGGSWGREYLAFNVGLNGSSNDARALTYEKMRITSTGSVGIGNSAVGDSVSLSVARSATSGTLVIGVNSSGVINSNATIAGQYFRSDASTAAASFTTNIYHYVAAQGTIGAGSTVTNQFGFIAEGTLIGATNNYGFYTNIAAGTGRWSFYAAGTAANYFAGNLNIGSGATADGVANQDLLRIINSNSGSHVRALVRNPNTTAGTAARYDVSTGTTNAYGIFQIMEDGAGNASVLLSSGAGVTGGIQFQPGAGNVLVTSAAGLGYGTGSGGTVTQATSKSTAVTLNKPTGQITMNNAALAAGAEVAFQLNNSLLTTTDILLVTTSTSSPNYQQYTFRAFVQAGNAAVYVKNNSGVSLSDAIVINFAVIKGAIA